MRLATGNIRIPFNHLLDLLRTSDKFTIRNSRIAAKEMNRYNLVMTSVHADCWPEGHKTAFKE